MQRPFDSTAAHAAFHDIEERLSALRALLAPDAAPAAAPEISVAIPIFNEQENIPDLYARLTGVLSACGNTYELVFVDDGSRDDSRRMLTELAAKDPQVVLVELSRNFGHQIAISAGMEHARGAGVIVMDADLQDPPEVLPELIAKWREGNDVVYAIRETRQEGKLRCWAYATFYRILHRLANVHVPLDAGDFCIMDRRVVDIVKSMPERNRFVRGIRSWVGLKQIGVAYARHARHAGKPKYTFPKLLMLAFDGMTSLSHTPLRLASLLGGLVSLAAMLLAVYYGIKRIFVGLQPPGFAATMTAILMLAGIQLLTIGVVGEYVGRIFDEVKGRPLYVVKKVTRGGTGGIGVKPRESERPTGNIQLS